MEKEFLKSFVLVFVTLSLVENVIATIELPGAGTCPKVNIIRGFDVSRFLGKW